MQRSRSNAFTRIYVGIMRATWKVSDPARGRVPPSLSLFRHACRRRTHVGLCVYVRDRYAIARAPTESMKIKREYSSPSEVKDALECRIASRLDTLQRNDVMSIFLSPISPLNLAN